jgi:hypothetical protein
MSKKEIEEKIKEIEKEREVKEEEVKEPKTKKKVIWVLVLALGILACLGIVFRNEILSFLGFEKGGTAPLGVKQEKEKFNFEWSLWEDNAGFAFEYPRELEVDTHPEDESNYSFLTLTSKKKEGKIDIICNDTQYKDINEWLAEDSLVKEGNGLETKVASLSAQRVALGNGREITAFIDWDEVIYVIDKSSERDLDYWNAIYSHLLGSFKLIPLEGESEEEFNQWLEGFETVGVDVVEAVEVIE